MVTTFLFFNYRVFLCFNTLSQFWLHYCPVLLTFSLFNLQVFPFFSKLRKYKLLIPVQNACISLLLNEIWPFKPCTLPKHVIWISLYANFPVINLYFPVRDCCAVSCCGISNFNVSTKATGTKTLWSVLCWLLLWSFLAINRRKFLQIHSIWICTPF